MTAQMIYQFILTLLLPLMIGVAYWAFHLLIEIQPTAQRAALRQFTEMAVRSVEQRFPSNPAKKNLAKEIILELHRSFHLVPPSDKIMDVAIESEVFNIRKM